MMPVTFSRRHSRGSPSWVNRRAALSRPRHILERSRPTYFGIGRESRHEPRGSFISPLKRIAIHVPIRISCSKSEMRLRGSKRQCSA